MNHGQPPSSTERWPHAEVSTHSALAVILADDPSTNLDRLTVHRSKAALPFAGKYRVIDFALSNCANSGIQKVGVITQYQPRSLQTHLAHGRPWDYDRRDGGLWVLYPYQARSGMSWYAGTADAIHQNQGFVQRHHPAQVVVITGSEIATVDLDMLTAHHVQAGADLTLVATSTDDTSHHTTLIADHRGEVRELIPPGSVRRHTLALMGTMVFSTEVLTQRLNEDAQRPSAGHDIVRDVIPAMLRARDRVMVMQYSGYWSRLLDIRDYWKANMALLREDPALNLQDAAWPIRTQLQIRPPARFSAGARVAHSLLSEGCSIDGTVEYSVLAPGVSVAPGAVVRHSILMQDVTVEERAVVENAIIDAQATVGPYAHVGEVRRHAPTISTDARDPLVIVAAEARIPANAVVRAEREQEGWMVPALDREGDVSQLDASSPA